MRIHDQNWIIRWKNSFSGAIRYCWYWIKEQVNRVSFRVSINWMVYTLFSLRIKAISAKKLTSIVSLHLFALVSAWICPCHSGLNIRRPIRRICPLSKTLDKAYKKLISDFIKLFPSSTSYWNIMFREELAYPYNLGFTVPLLYSAPSSKLTRKLTYLQSSTQ